VRYGFCIDDYCDLEGWKVVDLTAVPMSQVPACPADATPLTTICTLTSATGGNGVRVGCCRECGHISYVDRPTREWIYRYYLETWDADRGSGDAMAAAADKAASVADGASHAAVRLAQGLPIERSLPVCEIGCGYGTSLRQLAAAGFSRLVGIETSRHRAAVVDAAGFDVLTTPFEARETREALRARGPFGLIFTFHALEHVYQPEAVFAAAAELQDPGGHLIVSVPNQEGEPSMGVLMFLPHLHSFTPASLAGLAARSGYELADASANTAKTLNMVFRRDGAPAAVAPGLRGAVERATEKFITGLQLDRPHIGRRRLWWSRRGDIAGQVWVGPPARLGARNWARFLERDGIRHPRSVLVSNLRGSAAGTPLEIQFRDSVRMFFK
jgi:2-polyprenyl-3-methyl-5-hydroxy-6-metoxy-1,4-benzoquinol methylase